MTTSPGPVHVAVQSFDASPAAAIVHHRTCVMLDVAEVWSNLVPPALQPPAAPESANAELDDVLIDIDTTRRSPVAVVAGRVTLTEVAAFAVFRAIARKVT